MLSLKNLWINLLSKFYTKKNKSTKANFTIPDPRIVEIISQLGREDAEFFVKGKIK